MYLSDPPPNRGRVKMRRMGKSPAIGNAKTANQISENISEGNILLETSINGNGFKMSSEENTSYTLDTNEEIEQQRKHCKILDIQSSKSLRNKNIDNPFIAYLNINSLRNKIQELQNLIHDTSPEVITISETNIDHTFTDAQFLIDGYQNP